MHRRLFFLLCAVFVIGGFYISCSKTEQEKPPVSGPDWIHWRGPNADGTYPDTVWNPSVLNQELNPRWTFNVGKGYSSVVIKGDRIYTLGYDEGKDTVFCLNDKDGSVVWSYTYDCKPGQYSGPKATPFIDGDSLYSLSQEGHLFCFNAQDGKVLPCVDLDLQPPGRHGGEGRLEAVEKREASLTLLPSRAAEPRI